jgi:crotonobetainyl-CoA:carnitine CoA-transferase CaiB-like acyl-CoA transferase
MEDAARAYQAPRRDQPGDRRDHAAETGVALAEILEAAGIPAGPINTIDKVFADPQVQHLGIGAPITTPLFGETRLVASALNFHGLPREIRSATPEPGQHTDEVLQWLGYSREEMQKLRVAGVVQPKPGEKEQAA